MTNSSERRAAPREPTAHSRLHEGDGTPRGSAGADARRGTFGGAPAQSASGFGGFAGGDRRAARPDLAAAAAAGGAATANTYARFIPREEVHSFAAWTPGNFGGGAAAAAPAAAPLTPELVAAQLQAARQSGYQDGYRDGLVALEAFKQTYAQQMTAQIAGLLTSMRMQFDQLEHGLATQVAEVAIALARQVVRSELQQRPELVGQVAAEALAATLSAAQRIVLHLHPDDQALVQNHVGEVLAARSVRLHPDPAVLRGGCVIDTDVGIIDASVDARWRRATVTMGRATPYAAPAAAADGAAEPAPGGAAR